MANSFGTLFKITTWGESHGNSVGVIIDGCPPNLSLSEDDIQKELDRRKPGQSTITTQREEADIAKIFSGTFQGKTLGTPICIQVLNNDARSQDYSEIADKFRPSHADYTYQAKFGIRDWNGGGRAGARETIGRVAAGAIAKKILREKFDVRILACVTQIYNIVANVDPEKLTEADIEKNIVRCPDETAVQKMIDLIQGIRSHGDSVGGIISCIIRNVPIGWGEPVFDKLEADLAKSMLSIPAAKGFDIGSGFDCCNFLGSQHNDLFQNCNGKVITNSNHSGGIQGGISNGMPIYFRVAFKPTATILLPQKTVTTEGKNTILNAKGRHDPCVLPRAVPIVEAMAAITLVDHALQQLRNKI